MMFRKTCLASCVATVFVAVVNASYGQEPQTVFDYLAGRAAGMSAALPAVPDTVDAWEKQRTELVGELGTALGLPEREPMKAAVTYTKQDGDLVIEEVAYLWAGQTYASATVIRAKQTEGRQPAIVMPSGKLGHYTFLPYRKFVDSMAGQGIAVLFIDDPRTGRRQAPDAGLYAAASAAGISPAGIQVFDALRALDYLLTRADVDPGKIGIAGLGAGALESYMAAALEPRFQFVVAVGGTTTYACLTRAAAAGEAPEDPAAFVAGILEFTDMDRVAACLAPRPVFIAGRAGVGEWAVDGFDHVLRTMKAAYGLHDAADRICQVPDGQSDDMTPHIPEITQWIEASVLPSLKSSDAAPAECCEVEEEPDFSILGYVQRRIADQTASLPVEPTSQTEWQAQRDETIKWLRSSYGVDGMTPPPDEVVEAIEGEGLVTERIALGIDADFRCPALLVRPAQTSQTKHAGVVLSHDDRQCAASAKIVEVTRRLATAGYWVIVPDHASVHAQSLQPLANAERPSFYGDEAAKLYGPADVVGLSPLALRVAENLAAFRHLAARPEIDAGKIVASGLGIGGVDACLAALLEDRIAGVASVDATTMRDWALNAAPGELRFFHLMPYLPSLATKTDLDCLYGALAPRPLLAVRLKDGWPWSGFEQLTTTASAIYKLQQAENALLALGPRDVTEELESATPDGVQKQLIAAARPLLPTPPQPGIVGNLEGIKSRATADSASGLIWIVAEMEGYEQEFVDGGYRLESWSFFNDNGDAQKGRLITPLLLRKQDDKYELTGVGTTRTNDGTGVQSFDFEPVQGTDTVDEGYFFGWHTGDLEGNRNPGVAEFEDAPDALMIILTADGQMTGQNPKIGDTYRIQSQYRRRYSVMAVSRKQQNQSR